jgi:hypothetical protein
MARFHKGQRFPLFPKVQTGYRDLCPGAKWSERELTTHPYPVQRLEVNGTIPPLFYMPSWHGLGQIERCEVAVWDINTQSLFSDGNCLYLEMFGLATR